MIARLKNASELIEYFEDKDIYMKQSSSIYITGYYYTSNFIYIRKRI